MELRHQMFGRNPYYDGPVSDHFDGSRFSNPHHPDTDRSLGQVLRWKLREKSASWPKTVAGKQVKPDADVAGLRVTMVGHATLLVQSAGLNVLTDPVWSDRTSPVSLVGPKRVDKPGIAFSDLPPIHVVLLSHNHYDHLDVATLRRLVEKHDSLIVTPLSNDVIVKRSIPGARTVAGDWGQTFTVAEHAQVSIVPAHHWSARGTSDRRMALWGGFLLQTAAGSVYFAGDTGYGNGEIFRTMSQVHGAPDVALLPIGAYAPRWFMADQHTDPDDAVRIMLDLCARHAIGIHWGSFKLTDEAREEPPALLRQALADRGIDPKVFPAASPGDVFDIPEHTLKSAAA